MGKEDSQSIRKRVALAFLLAGAGCLGTLAAQAASHDVYMFFHPSPYAFLAGRYSGHWEWTQNNTLKSTDDIVNFYAPVGTKLTGKGIDPLLGNYDFDADISKKHINATYKSDPKSAQPAQTGSFDLTLVGKTPSVLKGSWSGFYEHTYMGGTVVLTKIAD